MNDFQKKLLNEFPQFTEDDFKYFLIESMRKVHSLGLPVKDCSINNIFIDAKHRKLITAQYCFKNCGFRCLRNRPYKKKQKWCGITFINQRIHNHPWRHRSLTLSEEVVDLDTHRKEFCVVYYNQDRSPRETRRVFDTFEKANVLFDKASKILLVR